MRTGVLLLADLVTAGLLRSRSLPACRIRFDVHTAWRFSLGKNDKFGPRASDLGISPNNNVSLRSFCLRDHLRCHRQPSSFRTWPVPPAQFDPLHRASVGINSPLLPEQHQPAGQRTSSSPPYRRVASTAAGPDSSSSDDTYPDATKAGFHDGKNAHGYRHGLRYFTSEFGSGSEANPALFAPTHSPWPFGGSDESTERDGRGRHQRRSGELDRDGGVDDGRPSARNQGAAVTSSANGVGRSSRARAGRSGRGRNRPWFDDPNDYEGDDDDNDSSHTLEERPALESFPSRDGEDKPTSAATASTRPLGRPRSGVGTISPGAKFVLGGDVVEGYVSLEANLDRRGFGDDRGGGLLLAGPPEDAETTGPQDLLCGGASGGLSMFRGQLYEEGRSKGNLASR